MLNNSYRAFVSKLKNETVFIIATLGAIFTSFFIVPDPKNINMHVLMILFNLMIVVEVYKKEKILDYIAIKFLKKYDNQRIISIVLLLLVFFSSMLLTNDVALITFVPLTIIIAKKSNFSPLRIIILETLCANIGGAMTPMGNPQNLYIFSKFSLSALDFFKVAGLVSIVGLLAVLILNIFTPDRKLKFMLEQPKISLNSNSVVATIIFCAVVISLFFRLDIKLITLVTTIYLIIKQYKTLFEIDWFLLATFVSFFVLIGNLSEMEFIRNIMKNILSTPHKVYVTSIISSQFISNVPAAILISEFTNEWRAILVGVNIGGFGTLIASLASVISYKLYINDFPKYKGLFLKDFTIINFSFLLFLGVSFYFFV